MDALKGTLSPRDDTSGGQKLLDLLKNPYQEQLLQGGLYASLGTSLGFTCLLAVCFSLLRPYNSVVYAPKLKVADDKHAPPPMGKGMFAWIGPVLGTKEQELIPLIGLDAVVFLRVLRMCRNIFLVLTVIGCGILIPINLLKAATDSSWTGQKPVSKVTPVNVYGNDVWGMVICAWLFNAVIAGFLWWNYKAILRLRRQYYDSHEYRASLHARTLMINDIPKPLRSDEGIGRLIDEVVPTSSFSRTTIARNVKELPELIEDHNETVRKLEKHLANYLRNPNQLPAKRPEIKPSKKDPSWGTYPKGQKVDAIEYLTNRIKDLEMEIKEVRFGVDNRNPLPYGFASYEDIDEAHSIAYAAKKKHPQGSTIVLAPRPIDIIWKNMTLSRSVRRRRRIVNNLWIILLTIVWIAPNAMIAIFLTSLSNLGLVWPAFQDSLAAHTAWWSIVQGVASPAITSGVYLILPVIFRRLAMRAGDRTKTARERHVASKLYTFFVFNFLIVFSVFSTLWTFVAAVIEQTQEGTNAWDAIKSYNLGLALFISLCNISPFWITWLLQRNLGAAVDLAQLWSLAWSFCARKFSSPTPREMIELTAPPAFEYAAYYNYFLFYSTVTLCYATIQPLCIPACALYFLLDVYLKKYLLLYIFITKTESGGMFWRMFYNRMVFATILANCVVFLAVWVHGTTQHTQAYAVVPLPLLMIGFKVYCKRTFDDKIHYYASRNNLNKDPEAINSKGFSDKKDRLASRFGHPALYRPLITPMVHQNAQNILASVYGGRLTDSNNPADSTAGSLYSDTYAMDPMHRSQPGKPSAPKPAVPGFEMVPENRLDFSYFKSRAEFGEEHGGGGGIYGRAEDIVRADTPGSSHFGSDSRPTTPVGGMMGRQIGRTTTPAPTLPVTYDASGDIGSGGGRPFYQQRSGSTSGLMQEAADMPVATPYREDERAPGFLGGGPRGYGGLPQHEEMDVESYDYFRAARTGDRGRGYSPGP
ncbi:Uncharacterized protein LSUE1_G007784 [Lachnellula suecica]|uniref:Calcium permeable stress-gated cation channel 1 n=1 Tax=Lachnellula suecica TaxID=602035 RepID=A0A8T9C3L6_9HELO|nr:Uncharacterized protein LSUE1_G007784 [Lachnellula suecica]